MTDATTTLRGDGPAPAPALSRRRKTQAERREEAEQRLLDAALRIVADKGSVRMTLAEVGEAAGYSRGLPAHHFGNKLGLLQALAGHIHKRFQRDLLAGPQGKEGLDAIKAMVSVYFGRTDENWTTTRALLVMMTEAFMADSDLSECMSSYNRMAVASLERDIRRGIELGQILPSVDPSTYGVMILGALRGVMMQRLIETPHQRIARAQLLSVRDEMLRVIELVLGRP
ncbi:MAG: TetR/AcrR family transcriptional regulator [Burkholderiaceae bacterium]